MLTMFNDLKSKENKFFKIKRKKFLIGLSFLIIIISSNFVLIDYLRENKKEIKEQKSHSSNICEFIIKQTFVI